MSRDSIWEEIIKEAVQYEGTRQDVDLLTLLFSSKYLVARRHYEISTNETTNNINMAKQPTLPLYYNDIARTCSTWTDEEFGCYMRLLMEQWDKGFIPNDYQRLTRLATSLDKNWTLIKPKFKEVDGVLKNEKMEIIRAKAISHSEKQKKNIANRYQTSTKPPTKRLPLEDESENEDDNENCIKSLEECEKLFLEDYEIHRIAFQENGFSQQQLSQAQTEFWNTKKIDPETTAKPYSDIKRHFLNWCRQNKSRIKETKNGNQTRQNNTSELERLRDESLANITG